MILGYELPRPQPCVLAAAPTRPCVPILDLLVLRFGSMWIRPARNARTQAPEQFTLAVPTLPWELRKATPEQAEFGKGDPADQVPFCPCADVDHALLNRVS